MTNITTSLKQISSWSSDKTKLQGEYYTTFGIIGTVYYIIPYFLWSHDSDIEYLTLSFRTLACILCFYLVIFHQTKIWAAKRILNKSFKGKDFLAYKNNISTITNNGLLPLYWHITLWYCLPLMSTYNLLDSSFDVTWVVSSSLSILTLVLLVDWISFVIISVTGILAGYILYSSFNGNFKIIYEGINYFLVIYTYAFSMVIGGFFLYQKETMINAIKNTNSELEKLNANLDEAVKRRTDVLNKALKSRTELLNNISHEIRTPLQGILGVSSTLVEHWQNFTEQEKEEQVRIISQSGDRLMSLISNLLDFSKFEAGKMLFDYSSNNLVTTVKLAIQDLMPLYYDKHIKVVFNEPENNDNFQIMYDHNRISQVIRNFLSNAIKYSNSDISINMGFTDEFGKKCNIENAYSALVEIQDKGVGIPENELQEIFFPFSQSSRTYKKAGGTGLGLAICAEIIHAHHGKIWAINNKDIGATFCFTIPLKIMARQSKSIVVSDTKTNLNIIKNKHEPYRVLFVDDGKFCLMSGKVILESSGFIVDTATCGIDAIEAVKNNNYDLILLDLMMPDMYGTDVLIQIKSINGKSKIPVILQSGASDQSEISKAISLGADGYIVKPYNKKEMLTQINSVLGLNFSDAKK